MKKIFVTILFCLFLFSCQEKSEKTVSVSNPNFKPELLFEIDGYKVYRFMDDRTVYFVIPGGSVHWEYNYGKGQKRIMDVYTGEK
jgi:hypothetical protein